jgi:starvation-inducible DNA-binding protein
LRLCVDLREEVTVGLHPVADDLQSLLVEVIDLSLTSKQARWILGRPLFEPLCAELDDLAADAWGWADAVGGRLVRMGVPPDCRATTVAEQVRFVSVPRESVDDADVVAPIVARLNEIIAECPPRIAALRESDPVSENLLISMIAELVKHRWVLASQGSGASSPSDFSAPRPRTVRG